jgi:hypothetical protein
VTDYIMLDEDWRNAAALDLRYDNAQHRLSGTLQGIAVSCSLVFNDRWGARGRFPNPINEPVAGLFAHTNQSNPPNFRSSRLRDFV